MLVDVIVPPVPVSVMELANPELGFNDISNPAGAEITTSLVRLVPNKEID